MKKILGIVLAFVMLVTVLAIVPAAQDAAQEDGYYVYLDDGINLVYVAGGVEEQIFVNAKDIAKVPVLKNGKNSDYSVATYLNELIKDNPIKLIKDLATALLNYGAAAQDYFPGDNGELVGTPVEDTSALENATVPEIVINDENGIYMGASLLLEGELKLRFYFKGRSISASYYVGDNSDKVTNVNGTNPTGKVFSYVEVPVMPYDMSKTVTITVGNTTVEYAPVNYLKNKVADDSLSTMVASIYAYGVAAEAYVAHECEDYYGEGIKLQRGPCVDGTETKTCLVCGDTHVKTIEATAEHTFGDDAINDDWYLTEGDDGNYYKTTYCDGCRLMQVYDVYEETVNDTVYDYNSAFSNANTLLTNASNKVSGTSTSMGSSKYGKPGAYPKSEHPRLLLNSATVDSIRNQVNGGDDELIKILKDLSDSANFWYSEYKTTDEEGKEVTESKYVSSRVSADLGTKNNPTYRTYGVSGTHNYNASILNSIMSKAFLYLYTGVDFYAIEATANILEYVNSLDLDEGVGDNCRYWGYAMFAAAIVYDWCYNCEAVESYRDDIIKAVRTMVSGSYGWSLSGTEYHMEVGFPPSGQYAASGHGAEYQILRDYLAFSLAIYDEQPDWYEYVGGRIYEEYVPVRNSFYEAGMYPQGVSIYAGIRFTSDLWSAWLLQSATGTNPYVGQDQVIRSIFSRVVDGAYYFFDEGDDKREISAWGQGELKRYVLAANISAYLYDDETAAAWTAGASWNGNNSNWVYADNTNVFRIIYRSNNDKVDNTGSRHEGLDLICYNGGFLGEIVAHGDWTNNSASVLMKIGGYSAGNHDHGDAGSFQIYYKGMLAGDTGFYDKYDGDNGNTHHHKYHQATIAHNSIVVYNNDTSYGQKTGAEVSHSMSASMWLNHTDNQTAKNVQASYRYDVKGAPKYAYIAGDISPAYVSSANVSKADRRMLSVFNTGNSDVAMYFFVYDRVTTKSNYQIAFLLHTAAAPTIDAENKTVTVNSGGKYSGGKMVLQNVKGWSDTATYSGDQKYKVNGTTYASSDDGYWGRIEIKTDNGTDHTMLNVIYVTDSGKTITLPAKGVEVSEGSADGVAIGNSVAVFMKDSTNYNGNLTFTAPNTNSGTKVNYYVSGMAKGEWTIECNGQVIYANVAEGEGILVFNTFANKEVKITKGHVEVPGSGSSSDNELDIDPAN